MKTISLILVFIICISSISFAQETYRIPTQSQTSCNGNNTPHNHISSQCYRQEYQEWVPEHWSKNFIPAKYRQVRVWNPRRGCYVKKQVLVKPASYKRVHIPGHYLTKTKWVCKQTNTRTFHQNQSARCFCQRKFVERYQPSGKPVFAYTKCQCQPIKKRECQCGIQNTLRINSQGTRFTSRQTCNCKRNSFQRRNKDNFILHLNR